MNAVKRIWPGLLLCLILSIPGYLLGHLFPVVGGPVFAILIGMVVSTGLHDRERFQAGIAFTSKKSSSTRSSCWASV